MKKISYKVPNGKLLQIQFDTKDDTITNLKITGDFFIYPEETICEIERFLIGKKIQRIEKELASFLNKKNIQIIGFTAKDLQEVMTKF